MEVSVNVDGSAFLKIRAGHDGVVPVGEDGGVTDDGGRIVFDGIVLVHCHDEGGDGFRVPFAQLFILTRDLPINFEVR